MYAIQARFGLGDPAWLDPTLAAGIFLFSLLLAFLFHKLGFRILLRIAILTPSDFDVRLVAALRMPMTLGIVLLGGYLALSLPLLDLSDTPQQVVNTVARVLAVMLGVASVSSMVSAAFSWYMTRSIGDAEPSTADRLMPLFRRTAVALVYGLGGLLVLDQLNVNISPLIAGMGLGGLAVALAIQPTLANLFCRHLRDDRGGNSHQRLHRVGKRYRWVCGGRGLAEHPHTHLEQQPRGHPQLAVRRDHHHQLSGADPRSQRVPRLRSQLRHRPRGGGAGLLRGDEGCVGHRTPSCGGIRLLLRL